MKTNNYFFTASILLTMASQAICMESFGQTKPAPFKITIPEKKVQGSLYNSIRLLDIRNDTTDFGIVQKGGYYQITKVMAETPLTLQFSTIINALIDNTAQKGELLLLLRQCSFAVVMSAMNRKEYFLFRAILFAHKNEEFKKIAAIDTVVLVKPVTGPKKIFRQAGKTITDFIASNVTQPPAEDLNLSLEQLPKIDSVEKSKLSLYTTATYTDGIYKSYRSFSLQRPDETGVSVKFDKKDKLQSVSYMNAAGKKTEMEQDALYAFVYEGKPYISGEINYYPLEKRGDDFYFNGRAKDVKPGDLMTAQIFFGIIGSMMASSATSVFEMKIDHLSGGFIRVKEVNK